MIPELPVTTPPRWLSEAAENGLPAVLPLRSLLEDSLFYPASGFDGNPVQLLGGNVLSFVYADCGFCENGSFYENFLKALTGQGQTSKFLGYSMIAGRGVDRSEIVDMEWVPSVGFPPTHPCHEWESRAFAHWSVWKRDEYRDENHGPLLLSLLFLGWEALAAFKATYVDRVAPKIIAIIQPGGGGASLKADDGQFKHMVMTNRAGVSEYLLCARRTRLPQRPCWDEYDQVCICEFPDDDLALWKLNAGASRKWPLLPE